MTNEKKYQITEEVLESWPGPRILQDETFYRESMAEHPVAACKVSEVYLITKGQRYLAGATYLAATEEGFELLMTANNGSLVSRVWPSFRKKPLLLIEPLHTTHLSELIVRPPIVHSNLLAAYTLHPFEGLPYPVNGSYEKVTLVDYFSYVLASETIKEESQIEYRMPNDMWWLRSTLERVFQLFDDFTEGRRPFLGAFDWNNYFRTATMFGFMYWAARNIIELMTYLTELFFDRDFTEGLYKFADGRAKWILERFRDEEYQAKVNAMMAIEAALERELQDLIGMSTCIKRKLHKITKGTYSEHR